MDRNEAEGKGEGRKSVEDLKMKESRNCDERGRVKDGKTREE